LAKLELLLDVGTTTVSGGILNRSTGKFIAYASVLNGQTKIADDLVSRIDYALKGQSEFEDLQRLVTRSINKLILQVLGNANKKTGEIEELFCVCNTAMHHILLGIDPRPLITPPYKAAQKAETKVYAKRIGLKVKKDIQITFLPNIASFIGSDALAVILATGIYKSSQIGLAIDIGTNGEIVLGNKDMILVASTAAGPAFEGRHISCGMPAQEGAIESFSIDKENMHLKTIGNVAPKGISGSGLIDVVSSMLRCKAMDSSGKMKEKEFTVYKKGRSRIFITQADIRTMQLAKGAIYAAIKVLLRKYNIKEADIGKLFVTGSFGSTINPASMLSVGIIPKVRLAKVEILKKGALEGLKEYVLNAKLHAELPSVLSKTRHIPLFGPGFHNDFASSLSIG